MLKALSQKNLWETLNSTAEKENLIDGHEFKIGTDKQERSVPHVFLTVLHATFKIPTGDRTLISFFQKFGY